ncbi:MAG: pantoate--beta-alanine ligase [Phycisphaerae bacterium]|nr:pantoate--beta-alanine ligase [Phycisphaerae bacterium]
MNAVHRIDHVREFIAQVRAQKKTVGLVPTMGALHAGHVSLIQAARQKCGYVVVSIFVNPTQFGPNEDFDRYPRPLENDLELCGKYGADLIFNPMPAQMYPSEQLTWITVEKLTAALCGASRPSHFQGVATVCTKLFNIIQPDYAFFGQKDAQQAAIIKKMIADLNMPLQIEVCPTVREDDGLAISSRNQYLTAEQRDEAPIIYTALRQAAQLIQQGETNPQTITVKMRKVLDRALLIEPEYIEFVDTDTIQPLDVLKGRVLVAIAAKLGSTRLIDNIIVDAKE